MPLTIGRGYGNKIRKVGQVGRVALSAPWHSMRPQFIELRVFEDSKIIQSIDRSSPTNM
jgi:hypothetical protein